MPTELQLQLQLSARTALRNLSYCSDPLLINRGTRNKFQNMEKHIVKLWKNGVDTDYLDSIEITEEITKKISNQNNISLDDLEWALPAISIMKSFLNKKYHYFN
jgi:hypothetical protein